MIFAKNQQWRTSLLPFSLALANTVNTGVSYDTASRAVANTKRWASRGFQGYGGYGPRIQYGAGTGMDGLGCGCGCNGGGGLVPDLLTAAAAVAILWVLHDNVWHARGGLYG
jgi:hypothetical protein